ncbi:MAG: CvpA family protein [Patescibacteria group bacterium]|nr:CvpA family protein [Patescibacteria group bacterium]MDD5490429.1 CvpA family protein [Patescibacteria group bacterium]
MILFDLVLLIILGGFILFGLWFGLIHTLGALVGVIAGSWVATHYYEVVANQLGWLVGSSNWAKIIIFIMIFIIVTRLVGLAFYLLEKVFNIISIIPFLKTINRLAGGIFGALEGMLVLGTILYVASKYNLGVLTEQMARSEIAPYLLLVTTILWPLFPELLKKIKSVI